MTPESLAERYARVKEGVETAARRAGRDQRQVVVVAVSKYSGVDEIRELVTLGHRDFGESEVPQLPQRAAMIAEWQARKKQMARTPGPAADAGSVRWHMIGHVQRNKVKKVVECARLIHSVDSLRLAEEIQGAANRQDRTVDVLLQVNVSGEASKQGCAPPAARHLADQIETMINVRLRGLMTMAPHGATADESRPHFARLRELFEEIVSIGAPPHFNLLSMGMSNDYTVAVEEGATVVRVGSAIFGSAPTGVEEGAGVG